MSRLSKYLCGGILLVLLSTAASNAAVSVILNYDRTDATVCAADDTPSWTSFRTSASVVFSNVNIPSEFPNYLSPINGFTMPFLQFPNTTVLYIDPDGFLSVSPASMCPRSSGFCASPAEGWYVFSPTLSFTGGDWPMIAIYTAAVDPFLNGSSNLRGIVSSWVAADGSEAIVNYVNMHQPASTQNDLDQSAASAFNGQIHLFANGTFIFRFLSVFTDILGPTPYLFPSAGAVGSGPLKVYGVTPNDVPSLCASRYDPLPDPCSSFTTCASCTGGVGIVTGQCAWCSVLLLCMSSSAVADFCSAADLALNRSTCDRANGSSTTDATGNQRFYVPRILTDAASVTAVMSALNASSVPVVSVQSYGLQLNPLNGETVSNQISLHVPLPFLDFPRSSAGVSQRNTSTVWVNPNGPVIAFVDPGSPICTFNEWAASASSSGASSSCLSLTDVPCALLPYSSPWLVLQPVVSTPITVYGLDPRPFGEAACIESFTVNASTGYCPAATLIELVGLMPADRLMPVPNVQLPPIQDNAVLRILLGGDGTVVVSLSGNPVLPAYPAPQAGIQRAVTGDVSLVSFTALSAVPYPTLVFAPKVACTNCNGRGTCSAATNQCVCDPSYSGINCESCAAGYYGAQCVPCPDCHNGTCDDGLAGTGVCTCPSSYGGEYCSMDCAAMGLPSDTSSCPACNTTGGYCQCGQCICRSSMGWSGPTCSTWNDPCLSQSFDGCAVCIAYAPIQCVYCLNGDFRCLTAPLQPPGVLTPSHRSSCTSVFVTNSSPAACSAFSYATVSGSSAPAAGNAAIGNLITNIGIIGAVVVLFVAGVIACSISALSKKRYGTFQNPLITMAIPNVSDMWPHRMHRKIVSAVRVQRTPSQQLLHGYALKQIDLRALHDAQQVCKTKEEFATQLGPLAQPMPTEAGELEDALPPGVRDEPPRARNRRHRREAGNGRSRSRSQTREATASSPAAVLRAAAPLPSSETRSSTAFSSPVSPSAALDEPRSTAMSPSTAAPPPRAAQYTV